MGLMSVCEVKRRRHGSYDPDEPEKSRRQATIYFTVPNGGGETVQVCKQTFKDIHSITKRRVETLVGRKKKGHLVYVEGRGNKKKFRKYTPVDESNIKNHIESLPKQDSHYTRVKNADKEYLSEDLSYSRLHKSYKELYLNTKVTLRFYTDTVKKLFPNLRFQKPRQDTCATCDLLHNQIQNIPSSRVINKNKLELHHRKAEQARKMMKLDHERSQLPNSEYCTISVDLQQVFSIPTLTHSNMYYLRQLSCYNLGVHVGDNNQGLMFIWHEGISGRGSNEIASCLFKTVSLKVTDKRKLVVWCDNCAGQNKNQMTLFLWIYLVVNGYFDEIHQKYLVSGHSFLSCDRDFALIEKRKRLERCEVPLDILRVIVGSCHKKPFIGTLMENNDFFNFKEAAKKYLNTKKLEISKVQWLKVSKENPGVVSVKKSFSECDSWMEINVFKKNITKEHITSPLEQLDTGNKIKHEKKEDIKKIIPYLREENKDFYNELIV